MPEPPPEALAGPEAASSEEWAGAGSESSSEADWGDARRPPCTRLPCPPPWFLWTLPQPLLGDGERRTNAWLEALLRLFCCCRFCCTTESSKMRSRDREATSHTCKWRKQWATRVSGCEVWIDVNRWQQAWAGTSKSAASNNWLPGMEATGETRQRHKVDVCNRADIPRLSRMTGRPSPSWSLQCPQ